MSQDEGQLVALLPDGVQANINPERKQDKQKNLIVVGSPEGGYKAFFAAIDATHGEELWVTDGTPEGTRMVKDIVPGVGSSNPGYLGRLGNKALFAANTDEWDVQAWVTDGTEAGTQMLTDFMFGAQPVAFTQMNETQAVFAAYDDESYEYDPERDLREAAVMLPVAYPAAETGKATRGAAVVLLMKVLMYQARPSVESGKWAEMVRLGRYFVDGQPLTVGELLAYDGSEDWEALRQRLWFKPKHLNAEGDPYETADTRLDDISSAYSLEYRDYFGEPLHNGDRWAYVWQWYADGEFCKGSVFEVVFKESADGTGGNTNEGAGIEHFDVGTTAMFATTAIVSDIFGDDVRKDYVIHHQGNTPDGEMWQGGEGRFVSLKWYTPKQNKPQYAGDNGRNRRLMRFAEVVLMLAEALNECGDREAALAELNKCKQQVNTINGGTRLYQPGSYGYVRDQIWQERRMEMAFEWDRYFDLVRQGRAPAVLHTFGRSRPNSRGLYFLEGVHERMPIPQNEIDMSNGVVEQNPGY